MGKNTTSNSEAKNTKALGGDPSWTTTFCNFCVEQIEVENRIKGAAFSPKGWINLVTKFVMRHVETMIRTN